MKKKVICVVSAIIATLSIAACATNKQNDAEAVYSIEYVQETPISFLRNALAVANGAWVLTSEKNNSLYFLDRKGAMVNVTDWRQADGEYIVAFAENQDTLYLCVSDGQYAQIRSMKNSGQWVDIASVPMEIIDTIDERSVFWVDSSENIYFSSKNNIYVLDTKNNTEKQYKGEDYIAFLEGQKSGKTQCIAGSQTELKLLEFDNEALVEKWSTEYQCSQSIQMVYADELYIYVVIDEKLLCIERNSGKIIVQADLLQSGVLFTGIYGGNIADKGTENEKLYLYGKSENDRLAVYTLGIQAEEITEHREKIVYGTFSLNSAMQEQIVLFNRENDEYYVSVRLYGNGDQESGKLQMQADMASGTAPDIVDLYYFDYFAYAGKGYLEDLTQYLRTDEHSNEIAWQIMEPYKVEEKLCVLMPHFSLSGLIIAPSDSEDIDEWNINTMFRLIEKNNGEKNIFVGSASRQILSYAVWGLQEEFIDRKTGKANFDSAEFIRLLEYCKEYGKEGLKTNTIITMEEMAEMTLFLNMTFSSPQDYMMLFSSYGRDIAIYGYPTNTGQKYPVNMTADACGIYVKSDNKEGAWAFMQTLLDDAFQQKEGLGWAICEPVLEHTWEMAKGQSVRINNVDIEPIRDSEASGFENIIENGEFLSGLLDQDIRNVVLEEAEGFFVGDKSAEEAAEIIQNRVQLILDE